MNVFENIRYVVISKYKYNLLIWGAILLIAIPFLPLLFENLVLNPEAPAGSDSTKAMRLIEKEFPNSQNANHILLLRMVDGSSILNPTIQQLTQELSLNVLDNDKLKNYVTIENLAGYYFINGTIIDQAYPELKGQFISSNNQYTYIAIETGDLGDYELSRELFEEIHKIINDDLANSYANVEITITGFTAMDIEAEEAVMADMERIDIISIPLVIIALAVILRNVRLAAIPLIGIVLTFLISFSIVGILATDVTILNIVPNIQS